MSVWLPTAKLLNLAGVPYPYLNLIASGSANVISEIKFEVTERCNLSCSFCHQNFGVKDGITDLDRKAYLRFLQAAKAERIPIVRITGGEPLLLKAADEYLRLAKEMGFKTIVNTNGTALTEKRVDGLKGLVDGFKISLPAANEESMDAMTGHKGVWRRKWEAIERLEKHGFLVGVLTVMTTENIQRFQQFIDLLGPHETLRWQPLRAETQDDGRRPVTAQDIRSLAAYIADARKSPRWKDLRLGLATPFCALENPYDGVKLFCGGASCGPVKSLAVTSEGGVVACYSRRGALDVSHGLRKAGQALATDDFEHLPAVCRHCPLAPQCRGGCRCEYALDDTPYGRIDYLAEPWRMPHAGEFAPPP
ncbi:MAG: radical SAM protein [Alphaproteobacteria bacterium]|nr:radical SAM protein [Alphaproteobacteria bacterium]